MTNPYAPPVVQPRDLTRDESARRDANWGLALGIASLFMCAPLAAPLAMWKAIRALSVKSSWQATVAIVLAALGLLSSALFWFLVIWQFLSPSQPRP